MRYLGSKMRISGQLSSFLKSQRKPGQRYVEPFCGACSILRKMDGPRTANDNCIYLITFLKCLQQGWIPPLSISEERYKELKQLYKEGICSPEIGFCGYFASFGGKWFGGMARDKKSSRDFSHEAHKDSIKLSEGIKDVSFYCLDYKEFLKILTDAYKNERFLIYCDPPYANVTGYKNKFDTKLFWDVIKEYSSRHDIYVSEYISNENFECVWSIERKTNLNMADGNKSVRTEKIFKYKG